MSTIDFDALLYGSGSWIGILIVLSFISLLCLKEKYLGLLMVPVTIFMGINYLGQDTPMLWHALIMFIATLFVTLNIGAGKD